MRRSTLIVKTVVLIAGAISATVVQALPPAPLGTAIAEYDPDTGGIVVSVNEVVNWFLFSQTGSFTGASPSPPLPLSVGGLLTDSNSAIGETNEFQFLYTDVDLGNVAAVDLLVGDLTIHWNPAVGEPQGHGPVVYLGDPGQPGDNDGDGDVDGNDFLVWQRIDASSGGLLVWADNFPTPSSVPSLNAVPEPASLLLVGLGFLGLMAMRRRD